MVERKLFKTKLCVLYQRGHCNRPTCSFAHGDAELRRYAGSTSGRRDYRGSDLRTRLGKRFSPRRRYSPIRDARGHHALCGFSPSRSLEDNSDRKRRKSQHLDSHSDASAKVSEGTDYARGRSTMSESKYKLQGQLKQAHADISMLEHHKVQLESNGAPPDYQRRLRQFGPHELDVLEGRIQEADSLVSKIQELEGQLHKEKKECRRINSRIKKFVKAHHRHSRLQEDLKRSQIQLQNMGDQLFADVIEGGNKEEDSSINIVSDGENPNIHAGSPQNDLQTHESLGMQELDLNQAAHEVSQLHGKLSRWSYPQRKHDEEFYRVNGKDSHNWQPGVESIHKREKNIPYATSVDPKSKVSGQATSSALASADANEKVDEEAELASARSEDAASFQTKRLSFAISPLPPIRKRAYRQHEGDHENVDRVGDVLPNDKVDVTNPT